MWKPFPTDRTEPITSLELIEAHQAGTQAFRSSADEDSRNLMLWGVDWQMDFLASNGTLLVEGGFEALGRYLEMAYDRIHEITTVTCSQDDHLPNQIFFHTFWVDKDGNPPPDFTEISYDDVREGKWRPTYDPRWQIKYVATLESHNKKLTIWPFHCLRGTYGATLAPAWSQFMMYWAGARRAAYNVTPKGSFWGVEQYAPQEALVIHPKDPNSVILRLYEEIEQADDVEPGGVAENFCLDEWVRANINKFGEDQPEVLEKFHFNRAYTAPIQFSGFEDGLRAQYQLYASHGVQIEGADEFLS